MNLGAPEILVILVVALLVFGPHKLPEIGRQVGGAMRELRKMQDTVRGELDMVLHPEHGTSSSPVPAIEPDDHSAIDATLDGHTAVDADEAPGAPDDPGFSGPSDSFI